MSKDERVFKYASWQVYKLIAKAGFQLSSLSENRKKRNSYSIDKYFKFNKNKKL